MLGPSGSVKVFGPQKGILPEMEEDYEKIMENVNHLLSGIRGVSIGHSEFSGAAGGISGGLLAAFSKCSVVRGVDLVAQASGLTQLVEQADLVISGEGSFDAQTKGGKVVSKVLEICPRAVVVCGIVKGVDYRNVYDLVSRFGNRSVSHVKECLEIVALEIFEKEILNGRRG
jgi:glycerate kinase